MSGNAETGIDLSTAPPRVELPEVDHPTDRPNFCRVTAGGITYWFSYRTCVAFCRHSDGKRWVRQNDWGPTTGKHLAYIDGGGVAKKDRLSSEDFSDALAAVGV